MNVKKYYGLTLVELDNVSRPHVNTGLISLFRCFLLKTVEGAPVRTSASVIDANVFTTHNSEMA